MLHPVVLSGGSGTRLWPLSRQNQPKQFLALVGERSLYQETILRAAALDRVQAPVTVCSAEATMLVMPADHLIEDEAAFRHAVATALGLGGDGWLVAFGIEPDYAETGYGYILRGESLPGGDVGEGYRIERFVEKPDLATAEQYLADGRYAWNSGMFLFRAQRYLDELGRHAPAPLRGAARPPARVDTS